VARLVRAGWAVGLVAAVLGGCGASKPSIYSVLRNFNQNNYPKVVEECQDLLAENPNDVQAYRFLIRASKQLGTLEALQQEYERAAQADPSNAVARFALGYARVQMRAFERALPELEKALQLNPQLEYANYVVGWIHFNPLSNQYDPDKGLQAWTRETTLNAASLGALQVYRDLGSYHEDRGEFELAREQMRAFRDNAFSEGDRVAARDLLEQLKENELELVRLQQSADVDDADVETIRKYAITLYQWQRQEDAIPYWERALALEPENAEMHNYLGMAHMEMERNDQAIAAFERAVRIQGDFAEPHHNLGMLYDTMGNSAKALAHFEQYLELQPFSQQAEVLRVRVDQIRAASASGGEQAVVEVAS